MFSLLKSAFQTKDVRNRIFYTLGMIIAFRIGTHITVPGVNAAAMTGLSQSGSGLFSILNTFGGGALRQYSIFALGVSPYITASIIVQLLQMDIIPKFAEWAKQGEVGRRKLNRVTVYLSIVVAFIQAIGVSVGFNALTGYGLVRNASTATYLNIALVLTAGTMLVVWIGDQMTQKGIGNGTSIIIFTGIIAQLPTEMYMFYTRYLSTSEDSLLVKIMWTVVIVAVLVALIMFVILMEQAQRKVPVQYSKRTNGASQMAYLPLKINSAGVIPVIFASSFILIPATILSLFGTTNGSEGWYAALSAAFNYRHPVGAIIYITMIILFTFFYAFIQVNPEKAAENLQRSGGYIIGVRPGVETEKYLSERIVRLSTVGAIYLAIVAACPIVVTFLVPNLPASLSLAGTNLLIIIGVILETVKQLNGMLNKRKYQGFIHD